MPTIAKTFNLGFARAAICERACLDNAEVARGTLSSYKPATKTILDAIEQHGLTQRSRPSLQDLRGFASAWAREPFGDQAATRLTQYLDLFEKDHPELVKWDTVNRSMIVFPARLECHAAAHSLYGSWFAFGAVRESDTDYQPGITLRKKEEDYEEIGWICASSPVHGVCFGNTELLAVAHRTLLRCSIANLEKLTPEERDIPDFPLDTSLTTLEPGGNGKQIYLGSEDGYVRCYFPAGTMFNPKKDRWSMMHLPSDAPVTAMAAFHDRKNSVAVADKKGYLYAIDFHNGDADLITQLDLMPGERVTGLLLAGNHLVNGQKPRHKYLFALTSNGALHGENLNSLETCPSLPNFCEPGINLLWRDSAWSKMNLTSIVAKPAVIRLYEYTPQ